MGKMGSTVWRESISFPQDAKRVIVQGNHYPTELVLLALIADINPEVMRKTVKELRAVL